MSIMMSMANVLDQTCLLAGYEPAGTPKYDVERVAALHDLGLLDTAPSETFDQVTRLASQAMRIPIVLVSLVDENRQWFKSRVGLDVAQTSRSVSFCAHVMVSLRPLIVPDAALDPRFAGNPLVIHPPHVRAYAGMPLFTRDGHAIGTLCAIDTLPREFDAAALDTLKDCTSLIQGLIYAHELTVHTQTAMQLSKDREKPFRDTFERTAAGILHASPAGDILRVNPRLCELLGYEGMELRTLAYLALMHPDDVDASRTQLAALSSGAIDRYDADQRFVRENGDTLAARVAVTLKRTPSGEPEYFIAVLLPTPSSATDARSSPAPV